MQPPAIYLTLTGLPIRVTLEWPFHKSTSGADWYSLHGRVELADNSGLHADVAVNLTVTIKEELASLEPADASPVVINALRKELDIKQLELVKSGKRQPVAVSSRHYDFKKKQLVFARASEAELRDFLARKTYWLDTSAHESARIADPIDLDYLNASVDQMEAAAREVAGSGLFTVEKGFAAATAALRAQSATFVAAKDAALAAMVEKHAFEKA